MKPRRTSVSWAEIAASASAFALFAIAFWMRGAGFPVANVIFFGFSSGLGLLAWLTNLKHYRAIHDTPTSSIASAAQGYIKLAGIAAPFPGRIIKSPLTGTECVWYRCYIPGGNWHGMESGESDVPFLLIDAEGQCVIEPAGAEIFTHRHSEWRKPDKILLHTKSERQPAEENNQLIFVDPAKLNSGEKSEYFDEFLLLPGDAIHAMGYFISGQVSHGEPHIKADISQRLTDWKEDSLTLLERFDLDGNQQIDEREWQLARSAARREVLREHNDTQFGGQQHRLLRPTDGRLFLLGTFHPRFIAWRYLIFALLNLATFFGGLWGVGSGIQLLH